MNWEASLIEGLQGGMGKIGEVIARVFSTIGGETVSLALLLIILFCYRKEAGIRCGLALLVASMWFPMVKNIAMRLRPYMEHESVRMLQIPETDAAAGDVIQQGYSFPSGHAAMSVAMYGILCREARKKWLWAISAVLVLLIGISRFAAGVHYPTDVLAGWGIGLITIVFIEILWKKVPKEWMRFAILAAVTLPGIFWCRSRDYYSGLGALTGMMIVIPYERKYVNFQDTRNIWAMILRVAGAMAIYLVMNTLLKMPFSKEYLNSGEMGANLIRSARYAIILFVILGVYPRIFPLFEKIGRKSTPEGKA